MSFDTPNPFPPSEIIGLIPGTGRVIPRVFTPLEPNDTPQSLFKGVLNMHHSGSPEFRFLRKTNTREFLIYTHGSCINAGYTDAQGACAFVYGPRDDHIAAFRLERMGPYSQPHAQSSTRAELRAMVAALRYLPWSKEKFKSLVIATSSEYVTWAATHWVRDWVQNGWRTIIGEPIASQDLWSILLGEVERLWDEGLSVSFWCIPQEYNTDAIPIAQSMAYERNDELFNYPL